MPGVPSDEPQRAEWLAWRRTGITATDAAAVLGVSKWASPWSIYANKRGLSSDELEMNDSMEFGRRAEPMLGDWFHDRTGLYVLGEQTWCTHKTERWMLATADGFSAESPDSSIDDVLGGVEFKTTTDSVKEWDDEIPVHIIAQVQWQMAVTGLPRTWLGTLHMGFGVRFKVRVIERDEDDIELLTATAKAFWFDHVLLAVPPASDGHAATAEALKGAYPGDKTLEALEATPELSVSVARIIANKARVKECEAVIDVESNAIRAALGDRTVLTRGLNPKGKPIVLATYNPSSQRTFNDAAALAKYPDLLAEFVTRPARRTLLTKGPKD